MSAQAVGGAVGHNPISLIRAPLPPGDRRRRQPRLCRRVDKSAVCAGLGGAGHVPICLTIPALIRQPLRENFLLHDQRRRHSIPGMNAAIRAAVVRTAMKNSIECVGIRIGAGRALSPGISVP